MQHISPQSSSQSVASSAASASRATSPARLGALLTCGALLLALALGYQRQARLRLPAAPASAEVQAKAIIAQMQTLKEAVQRRPDDASAREALAVFYDQNSLFAQSLLQWREVIRLRPDDSAPPLHVAKILLTLQERVPSEQAYQEITRRWPQAAEGWQGLSVVAYHKGDYLAAINAAQRAYKLAPKDDGNKLALAAALLEYAQQYSNADLYANEYNVARSLLLELTRTMPNDAGVYYMLGKTLRYMRQYAQAIPYLKRALELRPTHNEAAEELGRAYEYSGDPVAARKTVEDALGHGAQSAGLYDLHAQYLQTAGEPDCDVRATDDLQKAVRLSPYNLSYQEHLGSAYVRVGRLEDARKVFQNVLKLNDNLSFPYQQLAVIYQRLGQKELSRTAATMATRMSANQNQMRQVELLAKQHPESVNLHLILADRYAHLHMYSLATEQYKTTLDLAPGNINAQRGLAALDHAMTANARALAAPGKLPQTAMPAPQTSPPAP